MIDLLLCQEFTLIAPQSINGAAATSYYVDTQNVDWVRVRLRFGAIGAADVTSCGVTESDTAGGAGSYTAIAGSGATVTQTDDGCLVITDIDYRSKGVRKRYLKIDMTAGAAATLVSADATVAIKVSPTSTTNVGSGCLAAGTAVAVKAWNQV